MGDPFSTLHRASTSWDTLKLMDPNKLSMQEGKAFLRQLGIPQRDVDMMTEKWVVIASVEVLLRFPLRPGEDPGVRCGSREKFQPWPPRPHVASQGGRDPNRRKPPELLPRRQDEPHNTEPECGPTQTKPLLPQGPPAAQRPQQRVEKSGPQAARGAEETRVSYKNHPAFGRLASTSRCPTKSGSWAPAPPPLSAQEQKENVESRKQENLAPRATPDLPPAGSSHRAGREGGPGQRQEEQPSKAPPKKRPASPQEQKPSAGREPPELGVCLRQPTRPLPVPTTKKRSILGPVAMAQPPAEAPSVGPRHPTWSLESVPAWRACGSAIRREADASESAPRTGKGFSQDPHARSKSTASRPGVLTHDLPRPARSAPAPGGVCSSQARVRCPTGDSKASQPPAPPKGAQKSRFSVQAGGKRPPQVPIQICQNPPKKVRLSDL